MAWVEDGGKRVIELSGKSGYIWPLSSPNLTLAPPMTLVIRLKPEASGNLVFWDFNYCLTGTGPKFGVGYQLNTLFGKPHGLSDPLVASRPFLEAGRWQTLAIVAATSQRALVERQAAEAVEDEHFSLGPDGQGANRIQRTEGTHRQWLEAQEAVQPRGQPQGDSHLPRPAGRRTPRVVLAVPR